MRKRDTILGSYIGTNCPQVEMVGSNGKKRKILAGNVEQILRVIQSIPSPKAEPFKLWLAKIGYERLQETADPEKSINRARENWQKWGRSEKWIQQRMMGQETRNKLTDYWKSHDVKEQDEYAILTDAIFPNKIFNYLVGDDEAKSRARNFARSIEVPESQLDW